jgi:hypothetical protein
MRHTFLVLTAATLSFSTAPSFADRASADACAAKLSPDAKQIYAASIGSVAPGVDMKEVVRAKTRALVIGGKLSRDAARPAAEAAGVCLKQAR